MNNLNKKMSLALKLMTLAAIMNIATGCDSCKGEKDKAKDEVKLGVAFKPKPIDTTTLTSDLEITNNGKEEFDPATSDIKVVVSKVTITKVGTGPGATAGDYKIGTEKGSPAGEFVVDLKKVLTEKIEPTKTKAIKFTFESLDIAKDEQAEVTVTLKGKDKDGKDKEFGKDTLTWKNKK